VRNHEHELELERMETNIRSYRVAILEEERRHKPNEALIEKLRAEAQVLWEIPRERKAKYEPTPIEQTIEQARQETAALGKG